MKIKVASLLIVMLFVTMLIGCSNKEQENTEDLMKSNIEVENTNDNKDMEITDTIDNEKLLMSAEDSIIAKLVDTFEISVDAAKNNIELLKEYGIEIQINEEIQCNKTADELYATIKSIDQQYYWLSINKDGIIDIIKLGSPAGETVYTSSDYFDIVDNENYTIVDIPFSFVNVGDTLQFGEIIVNDEEIYPGMGTPYTGGKIEFYTESSGFGIDWIKVDTNLYIASTDLLTNVSWSELERQGFVDGKEVEIKGQKCRIGLMTGSQSGSQDINISYDKECNYDLYIANQVFSNMTPPTGYVICKESNENGVVVRGGGQLDYWGTIPKEESNETVFRPTLEFIK